MIVLQNVLVPILPFIGVMLLNLRDGANPSGAFVTTTFSVKI